MRRFKKFKTNTIKTTTMSESNSRPWIKHVIAGVIFLVLAALYCSPELGGKKINAHDSVSAVAAAKEVSEYAAKGETILWSNGMFSGMPMFQVAYAPKANLLLIFDYYQTLLPTGLMLLFTLMLGFYFLMAQLKINSWVSILASAAFSLNTYFILSIEAGHVTKLVAIAMMPALLGLVISYFREPKFIKAILVGIFTGLALKANHLQITYYTIIAVAALGVSELVLAIMAKEIVGFFKKAGMLLAFALLGAAANTVTLWTTWDYSKEATRGGTSELTKNAGSAVSKTGLDFDYAMNWSYGKAETFNLMIPNFAGGGSSMPMDLKSPFAAALQAQNIDPNALGGMPTYWGASDMGTGGPTYMGAIVIFLFVLSLFLISKRWLAIVLPLVLLSLFLAWGENMEGLSRFFFDNVPMYNKFRAPSMLLSITGFAMILSAALGLNELIKEGIEKDTLIKKLYLAFGLTGGLSLIFYLLGGSLFDFSGAGDANFLEMLKQNKIEPNGIYQGLLDTRLAIMKADALRSFFFIALAAGLVFSFLKNWLKPTAVLASLMALVVVDLWMVDKRYLNKDDFQKKSSYADFIEPSAADQQILQDQNGIYRVFNTTPPSGPFNDATTSYFHKHIGGYSAVKLLRYQELIENHLGKGNQKAYDMLNMRYYIQQDPQTGAPVARPNPGALGNAWFVMNPLIVKNADEENEKLGDARFNPRTQALVDQRFEKYVAGLTMDTASFVGAKVELTNYHPDKMEYKSSSSKEGLAVFSEIWYKGNTDWKATIDGKDAEFIRVNYVLRGLKIPAGDHKIEFVFHPKSHYTGSSISLAGSGLLLALLAFELFRMNRKKA
jgi:Bacterial membrane protein YfhO